MDIRYKVGGKGNCFSFLAICLKPKRELELLISERSFLFSASLQWHCNF